jgi:predicted membrane protein
MVAVNTTRLRFAVRAFGMHLAGSVLVALLAAILVFVVWFPSPFADMVGGLELFGVLIAVDMVCGPLLTLVLFNPEKSRRELLLDLSLVVMLQVGALAYGVMTMWQARPVYLAYEVDRFVVVTYANIHPDDWSRMASGVPQPGWGGPRNIAVRVSKPEDPDYLSQVQISLSGLDAVYRPDRWMPYEHGFVELKTRSRPMAELISLHPRAQSQIEATMAKIARTPEELKWLPVQSRRSANWVCLLDRNSWQVLTFLPLAGYPE